MVASFSKMTNLLQTGPIIQGVARHAVADDKVLEPDDVAFKVDAGGNVVMVGLEGQTSSRQEKKTAYVDQEKHIVVPRQEAYERIAHATHKKVEQLRSLYELAQIQARCWSRLSWIVAFITIFGTLLTSLLAVFLDVPQKHISLLTLLMGMNVGSMLVVGYLLWGARRCSKLANVYFDHFLEIENFYEVINIVSGLSVDNTTRGLLQKVIIAQSLGLQSGDIATRDKASLSPHSR